jgi:hypothetical protein
MDLHTSKKREMEENHHSSTEAAPKPCPEHRSNRELLDNLEEMIENLEANIQQLKRDTQILTNYQDL